jgi:hypothetical protein
MREILVDTADLFVEREETLGGLEDEFGPSLFILLRNFPLNASALRQPHVEILRERVVPFIDRPPGFAEIYGMTDRSGSRAINYKVGAQRVAAVQTVLKSLGATASKIDHPFVKSIGEDFFEHRHDQDQKSAVFDDGRRDGAFRVVVIALTPAPVGVPTRIFQPGTPAEVVSFCRLHRQKAS